ncbi:MAG: NAD(P)H-hydrate dehydratase [Campylobacteraceae bacterium]|nr:NAD(P)H-hydrate dehydratase [Campylobacteraceae bacterium]
MHPLYKEVNFLDARCREKYGIDEIIMMEHAAIALKAGIESCTPSGSRVLFVCGPGNNGADGIACARLMQENFKVMILLPFGAKSKLAKSQLGHAKALDIKIVQEIESADAVVDALFGSGAKPLDEDICKLIEKLNALKANKIACDIPTGLGLGDIVFKADITITMGALKEVLFIESAKSFIGKLEVANLGVSREAYETPGPTMVLEKKDMILPHRKISKVHKGNFGHVLVLGGEMHGAGVLAAEAAFAFGAGLVSVWSDERLPYHIMRANKTPSNTTAIVAGMGMGSIWDEEHLKEILTSGDEALVLDADILKMDLINTLLKLKKPLILTPHPKEFSALLEKSGFGKHSVSQIQANRISFARDFSEKTNAVLVLKGTHTLIAENSKVYLSPFGSPSLAKGGSGDVLAGLIGSLLAQGHEAKEAAVSAVLAHALASDEFRGNTYALTPQTLIQGIQCLKNV